MKQNAESNDQLIRDFMATASRVLESAVRQATVTDPIGVTGLNNLLRHHGGRIKLSATMAPGAGVALLDVEVHDPRGPVSSLMHVELHRETIN